MIKKIRGFEEGKMETKYGTDDKNNTEIKVSVIIPVCNVEKYLRECLDRKSVV